MSLSTALNLAIALADGRARDARAMLSNIPMTELKSVSQVQTRLLQAIERRESAAVYAALEETLQDSLKIDLPDVSDEACEQFAAGVAAVEKLINDRMEALRIELGLDK